VGGPADPDTSAPPGGHAVDMSPCCHDVMTTPRLLPTPEDATVVEVDGSRFVLEWLERETLASAALRRRAEDADVAGAAAAPPAE
jgi:hypothetical protein